MTSDSPFLFENKTKPILNGETSLNIASNLTLGDLAKLVLFKFGSIKDFGKAIDVSRSRACQILTGYDLPSKPETIKKIAEVLDIDAVVLTQLFSRSEVKNDK